ncbi:hypothetical protein MHBO_005273 [Bonamia ostreae]|uniref:Uncharacterized protein n=1 Tax=Bonamia ostreae TaxID=126728 RepID=A0ABV2AVF5_9EUKA
MDYLMSVNKNEWKTEVARYREFYKSFDKGKMPEQLTKHLDDLEKAMKSDDKK